MTDNINVKTKTLHIIDLATPAPLNTGLNSGALKGTAVHAPHTTHVVLLSNEMNII
jgi:hypothetical protein